MTDRPTYAELENKLQKAEDILGALRDHKVDAVVGTDQIAMMRLKEVEDQLHQQIKISKNRLNEIESIYQNVPVGLCILNTKLEFSRVNEHLAKIHGIPAEEHIGRTMSELLPNLEVEGDIDENLRRVIETGESKMNVEITGETPARPGVERHWLHHWLPLYSKEEEEVIGINIVIQEITDRKKYEKKLRKLNETLETRVKKRTQSLMSYQEQLRSLASQLSKAEEQERQRLATELHDNLGQMLAISKMKMDSLRNDGMPEEYASKLDDIKELIDNSLTFSRQLMSDLKPPPTLDKEDIRATIEWLANKMEKHDLKVFIEDDGQTKRTTKEIRTTLLQCIRELLFNVIKHAGVKEAWVKMSRLDGQVQLIVEDEGVGFNPKTSMNISAVEGGFGLFNISERLDLLGCSMDIDSEPGAGTRVKIMAPLKNSDVSEPTTESKKVDEKTHTAQKRQSIKVVLVDDHQMMRRGLKQIVDAEEDLAVIGEASDGVEAVSMTREKSPDVVIMDVNMPRKDGIQATQEIKDEMPNVRIVGLSLHDHQEVIDSMRSAGATAYLTKNEAFETLCATIRSEAKVDGA